MGHLELQDYRSELDLVFGERSILPAHYDRWVNFGIQELISGVRFEALVDAYTWPTVASQHIYPLGFQPLIPISVRNVTSDVPLLWIPLGDTNRLNLKTALGAAYEDIPTRWTMFGEDSIFLYPIPDADYTHSFDYVAQPDLLVQDDDVTVLPFVWDQAILYLAIAHGYLMLGEENRAAVWHVRAVTAISSRMDDGYVQRSEPGLVSAFTAEESNRGSSNA